MNAKITLVLGILLLSSGMLRADPFEAMRIQVPSEPTAAPDFVLKTLSGDAFTLSEHDNALVVLNFWATFCAPCIQEMPALETLWQQHKEKPFKVVAVAVDADREKTIRKFAQDKSLTYPIPLDPEAVAADLYNVSGLPVTYLILNGKIVGKALGERDWAGKEAEQIVTELLSSTAQ